MDHWTKSTVKIAGLPTAYLRTSDEHSVVGRYGEAWLKNPGTFKAVIYGNPRRARAAQVALGLQITKVGRGEDLIVEGPCTNLPLLGPILGFYKSSGRMAARIAELTKLPPESHSS